MSEKLILLGLWAAVATYLAIKASVSRDDALRQVGELSRKLSHEELLSGLLKSGGEQDKKTLVEFDQLANEARAPQQEPARYDGGFRSYLRTPERLRHELEARAARIKALQRDLAEAHKKCDEVEKTLDDACVPRTEKRLILGPREPVPCPMNLLERIRWLARKNGAES